MQGDVPVSEAVGARMKFYAEHVDAYEQALFIISNHGYQISSEECAQIAHKGLIGDTAWLLAWQEPTE